MKDRIRNLPVSDSAANGPTHPRPRAGQEADNGLREMLHTPQSGTSLSTPSDDREGNHDKILEYLTDSSGII